MSFSYVALRQGRVCWTRGGRLEGIEINTVFVASLPRPNGSVPGKLRASHRKGQTRANVPLNELRGARTGWLLLPAAWEAGGGSASARVPGTRRPPCPDFTPLAPRERKREDGHSGGGGGVELPGNLFYSEPHKGTISYSGR